MEIGFDGVFHCHNCGYSGTLRQEFPEFFDPIADLLPELFVKREAPAPIKERPRVRAGGIEWNGLPAPGETVPLKALPDNHPAIEYLAHRGFDIEELRNLDNSRPILYCTKGQCEIAGGRGTTSGRLVFPIYMLGTLKGWQARQIEKVTEEDDMVGKKVVWNGSSWRPFKKESGFWEDRFVPKYYTCPGMKRMSVLYGFDMARNYKEIAVVEGPLDYHRTGPQCVGTIGKSISSEQISLLKTYWERLFWLRDPEIDPRSREFQKILTELSPLPVHHLALANGLDPGATPREETWLQIKATVLENSRAKPAGKN